MKQSPVQYMFVELKRVFPNEIDKMYNDNPELLESVFQKAREKEKEVIMGAVKYGCSDWGCAKDAEQYYNETFNTKEK